MEKKEGINYRTISWKNKYKLAVAYYEHHGNLEVPTDFKTSNGYDYDENGTRLGSWISAQRQAYKGNNSNKLTEERINLLNQIGMRFSNLETRLRNEKAENSWLEKYNLAAAYYKHHGNLEIPSEFKTFNGYDYDENGIKLGLWIINQRRAYKGIGTSKLAEGRINLLNQIEMRFNNIDKENNWLERYNLAALYYEHYGNLEVPRNFKTFNGYDYDENGINLGLWISSQRQAYRGTNNSKLTKERISLLNQIGMRFSNQVTYSYKKATDNNWLKNYNLAVAYYEHNGNLEVPQKFITSNGYDYDENGIKLGLWITHQRQAYKGNIPSKLTKERINLLNQIEMRFENIDTKNKWMEKYNLAEAYYEHYGNLEVPRNFKTLNGYDYDENGINLGSWIIKQRQAYKGNIANKLTKERISLLNQIGMRFSDLEICLSDIDKENNWLKNYNLAASYYEHHGNLEVPQNFKTSNGYDYDENGVSLGRWICKQRQAYKGNIPTKLTKDRINLLNKIGMRFSNPETRFNNIDKENNWLERYNLATSYYQHYGHLEVPNNFKTSNGYDYDENGINLGNWITRQRQAYRGNSTINLTENHINLLNQIKMTWTRDVEKAKYQREKITKENLSRKKVEILNRVRLFLSNYEGQTLPPKELLNSDFLETLDSKVLKR